MLTRQKITLKIKSKFWHGKSRSQGMVEFAVALPILLMLLFAIIDFSLLFSAWLLTQNIARQAVRYAVTGQYDVAHCPMGGCITDAQVNEARLQTIYDEALTFTAGLFVSGIEGRDVISDTDPGYLRITVCTGAPYTVILPRMGSTQYGECNPDEHPGEPGQPVIVMADFNHPYLTPFLNEVWPMVHLASYHRGIVEQFRVSRLVNLPPDFQFPTDTPLPATMTFTVTDTPTETNTPTDTPTPQPIFLEIIWPAMDGQLIETLDDTMFEAIAYDPDVGTTNGDGIDHLNFSFSGPEAIPGAGEFTADYCAFSGNGPCSTMDAGLFATLPNSNLFNTANDYYMTVTAYTPDGREVTEVRRFKIMKPNTPTPTFTQTYTPSTTYTITETPTKTFTPSLTRTSSLTRTASLTPTMVCTQFTFSTGFAQTTSGGIPRVTISIRNSTSSYTAVIQSWNFQWDAYDSANPGQSYRRWYVGSTLVSTAADASSSTSWTISGAPTGALTLIPGETSQLRFDFTSADGAWPGIVSPSSFALTVNLDNGCTVSVSALPTRTWTSTRTFTNTVPSPTSTRTFTATNTVPTNTFTNTRTFTNTVPTPTFTWTFTRTNTVPTPTFTATFTRTNTVPTPTFTRTFTATNTVPTLTYTRTFTRTNTVPTPTFTFTNTVPTSTFTRTFTNTVPTSTNTNSPTQTFTSTNTVPTNTPTRTHTHTLVNTYTPTRTLSPTNSRTPTASKTVCTDC